MMRASSAPCGRGSKNQQFSLPFFFSSAGGVGGADKKWKGNFWFCFAVSDYKMNICIIAFVILSSCSFLRPHGDRGASSPSLVVNWNSVPSTTDSDNSSKWNLAIQNSLRNGEAQNLYVLDPPSRSHTNPRRF